MSLKKLTLLLGIGIFFAGCKKEIVTPEVADTPSGNSRYTVTFNLNWNSTDFPTDYPSNDHFSRLIGWSHQPNNSFFEVGTMASQGIEDMAEQGKTAPLDNELATKISNGEGLEYVIGPNLGSGVGQMVVDIEVNESNSAVSLVSMIAPSPDWYVGAIDINLLENGALVDSKTVEAIMYDAGTDDGTTYTSANADSDPQQAITLIKDAPMGDGTTNYVSIGSVTFVKQ